MTQRLPDQDRKAQHIHYLHTGQRLCHDADGREIACHGSGQDAEHGTGRPWPVPRFKTHGEVVLDRLTCLHWARDALLPGFPLSWPESLDFITQCNRRELGGHADWRLPDRREMRSLISHGHRVPALLPDHPFLGLRSAWYWTATTYAGDPHYAWYVHTEGGRMFYGRKDGYALLLPVRGRTNVLPVTGQETSYDPQNRDDTGGNGLAWPASRFQVRQQTALDRLTNLTWPLVADQGNGPVDWTEAFALPAAMNRNAFAGRSDWRLPTINELESLVDASQTGPALPEDHPFSQVGEVYWSSTNSAYEPDWSMCLYMHKGAVGVGFKRKDPMGVWCVAGGTTGR
jgi:hypothetical protein